MANEGAASAPGQIPELTSLRAAAALVVVLYHLSFNPATGPGAWGRLVADGHLGVDFFFILSGFILAHVYLPAWERGSFDFGRFLRNRIARIYPLHLVMLAVVVLAYVGAGALGVQSRFDGKDWSALPWHALLLHAWGVTGGLAWNYPSWSVSAELFAYLAFPLVVAVLMRPRPVVALGAALLFFFALLAGAALLGFTLTKMAYDFGVVRIGAEFPLGVALYRIFRVWRPSPATVRLGLAGAVAGICALTLSEGPEWMIVLLLGAAIYLVACRSIEPRAGLLRHPALVYLGEVSYSTYMVHMIVVSMGGILGPRLGLTGAALIVADLAVVYAASALLYHAVELPGRAALRPALARTPAGASPLRPTSQA